MVSFVCYNLKTTNIYIFIFNKTQNFINKKKQYIITQLKERKDGHVSVHFC